MLIIHMHDRASGSGREITFTASPNKPFHAISTALPAQESYYYIFTSSRLRLQEEPFLCFPFSTVSFSKVQDGQQRQEAEVAKP
jgi:hypothetical protein